MVHKAARTWASVYMACWHYSTGPVAKRCKVVAPCYKFEVSKSKYESSVSLHSDLLSIFLRVRKTEVHRNTSQGEDSSPWDELLSGTETHKEVWIDQLTPGPGKESQMFTSSLCQNKIERRWVMVSDQPSARWSHASPRKYFCFKHTT